MFNDDNFRFPSRPIKIVETPPQDEGDDSEDKSGSEEGEINLVPNWIQNALPNSTAWKFEPSKKYVVNSALQKKINLSNLDTADKILKLIAAFQSVPEMDSATFIIALQQASYEYYSMPLSCILQRYVEGEKIEWEKPDHNLQDDVSTSNTFNPHSSKYKSEQ